MTNITINRNNDLIQIVSSGHAGYSDSGSDIVCSAISFMIYSWIEYCMRKANERRIKIVRQELISGNVNIVISDIDNSTLEALKMLVCGFELLQNTYPENVRLNGGEKII